MTVSLLAAAPFDLGPAARFVSPEWFHAFWLAPAALLLAWRAVRAGRKALARLGETTLIDQITERPGLARRWFRVWASALALLLIALALARPQHGTRTRDIERRGRDIVFIVDVSRSMLARDLAPNRLERTKLWINDLTNELTGDRVALIAFAGVPVIKCPLTFDRAFFRLALNALDTDSAPRGGTMIGDAIRKALDDIFEVRRDDGPTVETGRYRDIILITDGEDQDSFPLRAAELAAEHGVRIISIGVGDSREGTPVPVSPDATAYVEFQGRTVLSRLDGETLARIASVAPGNAYLEVGTGEIDLARVYRDLIASAEQAVLGSATITEYDERFYLFIAAALALLVLESLVGEGRRRA